MNIMSQAASTIPSNTPYFKQLAIRFLLIVVMILPSAPNAEEWTYTTRPNDTIWDISKKHLKSVTYWKKLQAYNSVDIAKRLSPGTKLRIPLEWLKTQATPAMVLSVTGKVELQTADSKTQKILTSKQLVSIGDIIVTSENGSVLIQFADGSSLLVQKNSRVKFNTLSSYGQSGMVDTQLRLQQGRVQTAVKPLRGSISRYEITTPAAVAAVRGTAFRVAYEPEQETMASEVVKGSISVAAEGIKQTIKKGFGTVTKKGNPPQPPVKLLNKPNLSSLPDKLRRLPYEFNWPALEGATEYRIQISPAQQADALSLEGSQVETMYTLTELNDGDYILRVRGVDKNELEGFNAEHHFSLSTDFPVVDLIQPVNNADSPGDKLIFMWSEEKKASQYLLQISTNIEFTNVLVNEKVVTNSFTLKDTLADNKYYWRITAIDNQGNQGNPSSVSSFNVEENPYEFLLLFLYFLPALIL